MRSSGSASAVARLRPGLRERVTLLGRSEELAELAAGVGRGIRFMSLSGRAGVGKTAVLATFAAAPPTGFEVWDVDLAGTVPGTGVLDETARRLGLSRGRGSAGGVDAIAAHIRDRPVVLAVDHADELSLEHSHTSRLLDACPRLALVVVRAVAPAHSTTLITLQPLDVPEESAPEDDIFASPSVRLFVDGASRADPRFRADRTNARDIAEICRLVGGLPLAIELIAARVRLLPVAQLARELRGSEEGLGLDLLTGGSGRLRLSVREALASTCAQLSTRERRLLDHVSGFAGPFTFDAALAMGAGSRAETLDDLATLVDLRLIEPRAPVADQHVCDVLPIVRAFVRESTAVRDAADERRRAVLAAAIERASSADDVESAAMLVPLQVMRRDVIVEARRLLDEDPVRAASWLTDAAEALSGFAEQAAISEMLDDLIGAGVLDRLTEQRQARVLLWSAFLLAMSPNGLGLATVSADRYHRATAIIANGAWPLLSLRAMFMGIMITAVSGDLAAATALAHAGSRRARELGRHVWSARFDVWRAAAANSVGDSATATALALDVLEAGQRLHDSYTIVGAAVILYTLPPGAVPESVPLPPMESVLELARATGDIAQEGYALATMTSACIDRGRLGEAAGWCAECLSQGGRRGWWLETEISLAQCVKIAAAVGDYRFAARMLGSIRADRARIERAVAPRHAAALRHAEASIAAHLGRALSSRLIGAGQTLSLADAAIAAVAWLRRHATPEEIVQPAPEVALTPRELEVLALLADGLTNKEIAARLEVSAKTVMHHSMAIYRKLGVRGRAEATSLAFRRGLLDPREDDAPR